MVADARGGLLQGRADCNDGATGLLQLWKSRLEGIVSSKLVHSISQAIDMRLGRTRSISSTVLKAFEDARSMLSTLR